MATRSYRSVCSGSGLQQESAKALALPMFNRWLLWQGAIPRGHSPLPHSSGVRTLHRRGIPNMGSGGEGDGGQSSPGRVADRCGADHLGAIAGRALTPGSAAGHKIEHIVVAVLMIRAAGLPDATVTLTLARLRSQAANSRSRLARGSPHAAGMGIDCARSPEGLARLLCGMGCCQCSTPRCANAWLQCLPGQSR